MHDENPEFSAFHDVVKEQLDSGQIDMETYTSLWMMEASYLGVLDDE